MSYQHGVRRRDPGEPARVLVAAPDAATKKSVADRLDRAVRTTEAPEDAHVVLALVSQPSGLADVLASLGKNNIPVLAFAMTPREARELLAAGAAGAIRRNADPQRLRAAIEAMSAGLSVIDFELSTETPSLPREQVRADIPRAAPTGGSPIESLEGEVAPSLTKREQEVIALMAAGLSNRRIAKRLGISEHTAKFHVNGILVKLNAGTRTEAVVTAARRGLLAL